MFCISKKVISLFYYLLLLLLMSLYSIVTSIFNLIFDRKELYPNLKSVKKMLIGNWKIATEEKCPI